MTQKSTLAALLFSAATAAGATCNEQVPGQGCGNLPDPRQTTTNADARNNTVTTVNPHLSNTSANHNANAANAAAQSNSGVTVGQGGLSPTANAAGGAGGNQHQGQTLNFAPTTTSEYTYKESAHTPGVHHLAPAQASGCLIGGWGVSVGLQFLVGGTTAGYTSRPDWTQASDECEAARLIAQALASTNPAVRFVGLTAAAKKHPETFGAGLVGVREAVTSGDPLLYALGDNYRAAAAPVTVTVVDNNKPNKNPCANKPGTTPVWNATKSDFECRNNVYNIK